MTRFINPRFPVQHQGADRLESLTHAVQQVHDAFPAVHLAVRRIGALRLSVLAAALLAVAYDMVDSAALDYQLWMSLVLWAALFAVLAFLRPAMRQASAALKGQLNAWSCRRAQARANARLWSMARLDPRIMADLQAAIAREEALVEAAPGAAEQPGNAEPAVKLTAFMAQAYAREYI